MNNLPAPSNSHPLADRARFELFLNVFVRNPQCSRLRRCNRKR
jgi:hypothetical protein